MATPPQIFLCYAREDFEIARDLYKKLSEAGFTPWMDKVDLAGGQRWRQDIPKALRTSDFILVLLSRQMVAQRG